ncbi:MAG: guanylate kinase, partial [Oscillospiraceae bacterium]|nr:guanylate kinase [Oscillospiraceae bacterium]
MKGNLFVISGPSGAGKGTICAAYMEKHPEMYLSVSATTREPREGEIDGVSYHFINVEEFRAGIARGGFLEHAEYCGNYYGTPKDKVLEQLNNGRDVILEIESDGAMQVRSHYPEGVYIFV